MANDNALDALLSQVPVGELAAKLGVDEDTALAAVKQALPGLLGGLAVNAASDEGKQKLEGALSKHTPTDGKISLEAIDEADGQKIVKHVLGDKEEAVANALGAQAGNASIAKYIPMLLPLLAPIVMQFLAGKSKAAPEAAEDNGGGIGDVLGGLLGGLTGGNQAQSTGGGIGDLLGGLLGGGKSQSGGGLGGLLGGLLGK
ncbi:DUF937 domain-containing protein [Leucobacter aridicollis]|uniref:DUF937 domain-containing protein n=1 Tax=Leucobacter aridicollis TaxID=283878 RepID=UPI000E65CB95|nr:DUF937 domain-containing protein [Leucobacter aridicollis]UTX53437.1 DUF937 domain-containing protein [Leucobacter aridicollis]